MTWWYGLLPTYYAGLYLRNTHVLDSRIIDEDWADLSISKPNFAVHPPFRPSDPSMIGSFDTSGFISLPEGGSFDIISFWVQCDWPCELHIYEMGFSWDSERELLTNLTTGLANGRLHLPGGVGTDEMEFLYLEEMYGRGAGQKVRWLRYWAKDLRENGDEWGRAPGEVAVGIDDLVIRRRISGPACVEFNPDRDATTIQRLYPRVSRFGPEQEARKVKQLRNWGSGFGMPGFET